jgi:hypothetical protein
MVWLARGVVFRCSLLYQSGHFLLTIAKFDTFQEQPEQRRAQHMYTSTASSRHQPTIHEAKILDVLYNASWSVCPLDIMHAPSLPPPHRL